MTKNRKISLIFAVITVLLLCVACSTIAFSYSNMLCAMKHAGASAPPSVAFLLAIPFSIVIAISLFVCIHLYKK